MRAALSAFILFLAPFGASGCFGPVQPPADPYAPRTHIAIVNATGVEVREPACTPEDGCTEYFFVELRGSENWTLVRGPTPREESCTRPWSFDAYAANQTVKYNATRYDVDATRLNTLMAENFWGVSISSGRVTKGCPTAYGIHPYPASPNPHREQVVGSYGGVEISVYRSGFLVFGEKYFVDLGKKVVVSYGRLRAADQNATYFVSGGFEIINWGPWPKSQLIEGASGRVGSTLG